MSARDITAACSHPDTTPGMVRARLMAHGATTQIQLTGLATAVRGAGLITLESARALHRDLAWLLGEPTSGPRLCPACGSETP